MSKNSLLNSANSIVAKFFALFLKVMIFFEKNGFLMGIPLTYCIYGGLKSRWLTQQGDAAGYVDALSASENYNIDFSYGLSFNRGVELFQMDPVQGCVNGFYNPYSDISFLRVHPYLFAFLSKLLDPRFLPIPSWPLLLLSLSYAFGITTIFQLVKRYTNFTVAFTYITLVLIASPLFYESLRGQPYLDRLAFGPIVILLSRLYEGKIQKKNDLAIVILLGLLTASFSERAALISGLLLMIAPIIFVGWRTIRGLHSRALLTLGLIFLLYYFLWNNIYSVSAYQGNTDPKLFLPNFLRLINGDRNFNFQIFLFVLAPFIILSLAKLRNFALVLLAVLPNLLVDVGGAELSGFSTHYLAFVLPVLSITSSLGCIEVYKYSALTKRSNFSAALTLFITLISLLSINLYNSKVDPGISHLLKVQKISGRALDALGFTINDIRLSRNFSQNLYLDFIRNIDKRFDKVVTTPEQFMPALLANQHRKVEMFPVGIGMNEYLIIPFTTREFQEVDYDFNGLISLEDQKLWSTCIKDILRRDYIEKAQSSEMIGNFILYKKKS